MRWPRHLLSLLFVSMLLAGPPMVLLSLVGPPIAGWPTAQQAREWVQQPLTAQTLTVALTIAAWLVWLVLAYTVTIRVLTRLRATVSWLRHLPLPTPLQATASGMAGAAVFGVSANAVTTAPPQPPHPLTAGTFDDPGDTTTGDRGVVSDAGIAVSGGWLPREVAEQVAAAGALVWLRRRRTYRPRPPAPLARDDQDLAPLPPTAVAVQAALADHPARPADAASTQTASAGAGGLPAFLAVLPHAGVGLDGPGALAAGRGLLVSGLLAGQRHPTEPLVITRTVLTNLLGSAETLGQNLPWMSVVDSIDEAVHSLQPRPDAHPDASPDKPRRHTDETAGAAHLAPVLIVEAPAPGGTELELLAGATAARAATVVVLGEWPAGATWHVDPAGHTHDPRRPGWAGPRLCVLDATAATDLLTVIAYTNPPPSTPTTDSSPHPVATGRPVPRQPTRQSPPAAQGPPRRLTLRVLGEPALLVDGEPMAIRRTAAVQVLVYLAAHPDGAAAGQLTAAIWPGLPRHSLTGRLYTTLSELRRHVHTACGLNLIEHTDDRYRLNPAHADVDLWRLHTAIEHAATAVTDTTAAWQAVIDAYPDTLAAGRTWPWLQPVRETLRRGVIDAHFAAAAAEPDPRRALNLLQGGIRVDPYNADLHTRAVRALITLGDHDAADHLREDYTRRLAAAGILPTDRADTTATLTGQPAIRTR
ncbi:hypothetical protein ACFOOK_24395 [Micromonospora krabiensis]|uniref:Bacterial transcriptional activator domain-containing protein n=1 Tax=Micromonospora krabiensis TaxID=307121 RepID=A0A1C3N6X5_9ACTN|nr:hypothetical protein [Micromonospora krabiensis]SBV28293.1 hypothetical protein GA0070620_3833 [Micromonospora krabiensis]